MFLLLFAKVVDIFQWLSLMSYISNDLLLTFSFEENWISHMRCAIVHWQTLDRKCCHYLLKGCFLELLFKFLMAEKTQVESIAASLSCIRPVSCQRSDCPNYSGDNFFP